MPEIQNALEKSFSNTSKMLFGEPIGALKDFEPYLKEIMFPYAMKKSSISGKDTMISSPHYPENAKFISQDEIGLLNSSFSPLNINEIKDIDSLFDAVSEKVVYCGNKLFGKNNEVQEVDNCVDCSNILHGHTLFNVKYGAYVSCTRETEHVFGVSGFPKASFSMRMCIGIGANRCFESHYCSNISEMYYAFNCIGCSNCIFAFNLRSKRNVIGNLELPKDKFLSLKTKLVAEMADELKRKKRIFSITDIVRADSKSKSDTSVSLSYDSPVPQKVEEAYSSTTRIVFGKEHKDLAKFAPWLLRHALKIRKIKGAFGKPTYKHDDLPVFRDIPANKLVSLVEGFVLAKKPIEILEGEEQKLNLKEILALVAKNAYFSVEFVDGQNNNCVDTPSIFTGSNVYKLWDTTNSKYSAYSSAVVESEHIFGGYLRLLNCGFCINCYDSTNLKGCFEVDASYNTRDSYFCHNVENLSDCMFCFNVKSLQYAIGNQIVGKKEFLRVKKLLLDYVNRELAKNSQIKEDIFSIGSKKK
ncbi:hypothetical protein HY988_04190 [Candidatus Micrarchaeota archaeon]|nr:hypothetical protein [Candidatus Micrarchaeota archaeon]